MKHFTIIIMLLLCNTLLAQQKIKSPVSKLPIGVFDSGTGGLTVLEAMLSLDFFNNETGKPGADGKSDFENEFYQYLADQANMPYGNYAAENKTALLKEHIIKNMDFLLKEKFSLINNSQAFAMQPKQPVKMIVIACNTATAYALGDIKVHVQQQGYTAPVIGVIDAGSKAALAYQEKQKGTIGVFATAGTVASDGYPRTLKTMAVQKNMMQPSIISQGGFGLAESIDRDWSFYVDTLTKARTTYKGPSLKNKNYTIDTALLNAYRFNRKNNELLCEYDDTGKCLDVQLNEPANYVRYHLVSLLEKMRSQNVQPAMNTLILGCTHYPYMKDTIANVLKELYNYQLNGEYRYRKYLNEHVELIDPSVETAKEAYAALRSNNLLNNKEKGSNHFFITVPNTQLTEIELQPDGWFTYNYKYGRKENAGKNYVQYVPFSTNNISTATYGRFKLVLPHVYKEIAKAVTNLQ